MRMMGVDSVNYHRETVLERADDHPGAALEYYASRGETPLVWGGSGVPDLGLEGAVSEAEYDAIFGPGGARNLSDGTRLVNAKRPGMELVVAAQKSVALLGLIGRADDMHAILDAETDATLSYLDTWMMVRGGRRGRLQTRGPTHGLVWARTRHATSRAGDPEPHDHVLIANVCHMADGKRGWKAVDTAALRDVLHAATAFGRVASAAKAIGLGYPIEADDGPSGRLGHWRIAGMPEGACQLFSKRSAEITAAVESKGYDTYQARQTAARDTRKTKRHTPPTDLVDCWIRELSTGGYTPEGMLDEITKAAANSRHHQPQVLSASQLAALASYALGVETGIGESRTIASLLWRLDHGQAQLDSSTVVICDEAGMTDDPAMLRLLAATEAARSKLIIVGDHRQLGAVGPGGSLQALVARHTGSAHALRENVRQADPEERTMLAQLRAGSVEQAVNWYADHGRITTAPDREQALEQTVAAWVDDLSQGRESAMMAWRRANVAALNARARQVMQGTGRLSGPELNVGGNVYQAGDKIVALAPSAYGQLVTSQRGRVVGVDLDAGGLTVRMDDGRTHVLGPDQICPDQLALGYATTVHRSQGATFDTAHLFADGGGRELGYVAMSRARDTAYVHAVADNVYQAVEDLTWDWSREKRQAWGIDTGTPETQGRHPLEIEADNQAPAKLRAVLSRARLKAERAALAATASDQPDPALRRQVAGLDRHIQLLDQRLDPSKHPLARQPFSTPVESPAPERSIGPTL
jgi:conjugative relaxase-like TrwC/TraI family protein